MPAKAVRARHAPAARWRGGGERGAGAVGGAARTGAPRGADDVRRENGGADLPEFLQAYPDVSIDLHLSDAMVDLIGEGFDAGLRIASLPDSSLIARRLCAMPRFTVASPAYLKRHGRPTHPMHLAQHKCLGYAYLSRRGLALHQFSGRAGERAAGGPLRVNNGEALLPALIAGLGIADLPEFIVGDAIASARSK
jgi:DNA-binding transcriptional LysR family regulator